eukprot:752172-Hanusia_phi.AAC.5
MAQQLVQHLSTHKVAKHRVFHYHCHRPRLQPGGLVRLEQRLLQVAGRVDLNELRGEHASCKLGDPLPPRARKAHDHDRLARDADRSSDPEHLTDRVIEEDLSDPQRLHGALDLGAELLHVSYRRVGLPVWPKEAEVHGLGACRCVFQVEGVAYRLHGCSKHLSVRLGLQLVQQRPLALVVPELHQVAWARNVVRVAAKYAGQDGEQLVRVECVQGVLLPQEHARSHLAQNTVCHLRQFLCDRQQLLACFSLLVDPLEHLGVDLVHRRLARCPQADRYELRLHSHRNVPLVHPHERAPLAGELLAVVAAVYDELPQQLAQPLLSPRIHLRQTDVVQEHCTRLATLREVGAPLLLLDDEVQRLEKRLDG